MFHQYLPEEVHVVGKGWVGFVCISLWRFKVEIVLLICLKQGENNSNVIRLYLNMISFGRHHLKRVKMSNNLYACVAMIGRRTNYQLFFQHRKTWPILILRTTPKLWLKEQIFSATNMSIIEEKVTFCSEITFH